MKIAVATDDNINVMGHVGRCNAFIIFTIENLKIINREIRENNFTHHRIHKHNEEHHHGEEHSHGHGHGRVIEALKDCSALILQSGGWRIINDLQQNNIIPVLTDEKNAEEAAIKYVKGELKTKEENICRQHQVV